MANLAKSAQQARVHLNAQIRVGACAANRATRVCNARSQFNHEEAVPLKAALWPNTIERCESGSSDLHRAPCKPPPSATGTRIKDSETEAESRRQVPGCSAEAAARVPFANERTLRGREVAEQPHGAQSLRALPACQPRINDDQRPRRGAIGVILNDGGTSGVCERPQSQLEHSAVRACHATRRKHD